MRSRVAQFFGRDPLTHLPPEEVVGLGAAILAEALTGGVRKGPITQRMFASGEAAPAAGGSNAGPMPPAPPAQAASASSTSPFRGSTIVGNPGGAAARPATTTSPFRAQTPPPLPPGARAAPPPVPPPARRSEVPPAPPALAKGPPAAMPGSPRSTGVSFDLDDPFEAAHASSPDPYASTRPTPLPQAASTIGSLDEPSFVGKNPANSKLNNTRPYEQPVPAFNLDDPSVSVPLASLVSATLRGATPLPPDEERTQTHDFRSLQQAALPAPLTAALPAPVQAALPANAPDLPANAPELPDVSKPAQPPLIAPPRPPIGAAPKPSSPGVQTLVAKPPLGAPPRPSSPEIAAVNEPPRSGLAAALSALPPSIAAAIKPPPPRPEAPPPAPLDDEETRAMASLDEKSVPSFKLDASLFDSDASLFGDAAKPPLTGPSSIDASVPSFRIDADDIFGPSGEVGGGTLVAKSPFEPTLPEAGSSTVALEAPPQAPRFGLDADDSTRKLGVAAAAAVAVVAAAPPLDEATRAMPTAPSLDDPSLPPMVVPAPLKAAVPVVRPAPPAPPASSLTGTLQAGAPFANAPQGGGDMLKPGLPPARPSQPGTNSAPPPRGQPASMPPATNAASASGAPPRGPAPGSGIAVPLLLDVTPLSLGVETACGLCETVIRRNATIPVEQSRVFATTNDDQTTVVIRISQGESRKFSENQCLGELELTNLKPAPRGEISVAVTFELGADGTLNVRARDVETGREQATRVSLLTIPTETAQAEMAARQRSAVVAVPT